MPPQSIIDFDLQLDKEEYSPGDRVTLDISTKDNGTLFTSLKVIDVSSLLRIPQYKHSPSLASMVYLEREMYELNINPGSFFYSHEYVEHMFESTKSNPYFQRKGEEYYNLYT